MNRLIGTTLGALLLGISLACQPNDSVPNMSEPPVEVTNRISVSPEVISNLGITFQKAKRGKLGDWMRVPGRLEVPRDRSWTIRAPADGRVRPRVRVSDVVEPNTVLAVFDSPALMAAQAAALASRTAVESHLRDAADLAARLPDAESLVDANREFEAICERRANRMRELQSHGPDAAVSSKERLEAEQLLLEARERALGVAALRDELRQRSRRLDLEVERARLDLHQAISTLSVLTGLSSEALVAPSPSGQPTWITLANLELRAPHAGVVASVTAADGEHVPHGTPLLTIVEPSMLAFVGLLPESSLGDLRALAPTRVHINGDAGAFISTQLWEAAPTFEPESRSLRVSAWVPNAGRRLPHGISAMAEIQLAESQSDEVLIPESCVVFDGLEAVVFRRDPSNPSVVTRIPVELGARSAGTVEVLAGVLDGDEVVEDGAHQLNQTGMGRAPEGGHFHADGTWHEGH